MYWRVIMVLLGQLVGSKLNFSKGLNGDSASGLGRSGGNASAMPMHNFRRPGTVPLVLAAAAFSGAWLKSSKGWQERVTS